MAFAPFVIRKDCKMTTDERTAMDHGVYVAAKRFMTRVHPANYDLDDAIQDGYLCCLENKGKQATNNKEFYYKAYYGLLTLYRFRSHKRTKQLQEGRFSESMLSFENINKFLEHKSVIDEEQKNRDVFCTFVVKGRRYRITAEQAAECIEKALKNIYHGYRRIVLAYTKGDLVGSMERSGASRSQIISARTQFRESFLRAVDSLTR